MCSNHDEQMKKTKEFITVKNRSLMEGIDPKIEPVVALAEKVQEAQKKQKQKLGGQQTETTQTPTVTPTEVNSLGGATALDRKNKKGVASTITSNTILGSSKGG